MSRKREVLAEEIKIHSDAINQLTYQINHMHEVADGATLVGTKQQLKAERTALRADRKALIAERLGLVTFSCYQCEEEVEWLAPDSRCGDCTGYTPEEIRGE